MIEVVAVHRYAQAIFNLAQKTKQVSKVQADLDGLSQSLVSSGLKSFLENPSNAIQNKLRVVELVGKKLSSTISTSFLHLLLKKSRIHLLGHIANRFEELRKEASGVVPCEVVLASEPKKEFLQNIQAALKRITHSEIEMAVKVDPDIIGGAAIHIKHRVLDTTFQSQLREMKQALLSVKMH